MLLKSEPQSKSTLKKVFLLGLLIFLVGIGVFFYKNPSGNGDANKSQLPVVAITQIIHHNTLDQVYKGLEEGLKEAGYENGRTLQLIYENANGNLSVAAQIGTHFLTKKPTVLVALSTQSAQILMPIAQQNNIPLVFSAVTDPISAKLVDQWTITNKGVTGVSDYMGPKPQLSMIRSFIPNLKSLGVLYNPSEVNSVSFLKSFEEEALRDGIIIVRATANNTAEAAGALNSLAGKVDAVFFPNDNTIMAAAPAVAAAALQNHLPLFANDEASVNSGALAALSFDRIAMGKKTAEIIVGILKGNQTTAFPVTNDVPYKRVVNDKTLASLGLKLPDSH